MHWLIVKKSRGHEQHVFIFFMLYFWLSMIIVIITLLMMEIANKLRVWRRMKCRTHIASVCMRWNYNANSDYSSTVLMTTDEITVHQRQIELILKMQKKYCYCVYLAFSLCGWSCGIQILDRIPMNDDPIAGEQQFWEKNRHGKVDMRTFKVKLYEFSNAIDSRR